MRWRRLNGKKEGQHEYVNESKSGSTNHKTLSVVEDLLLDRMVRGHGYLSNMIDCLCFVTSVESLVTT